MGMNQDHPRGPWEPPGADAVGGAPDAGRAVTGADAAPAAGGTPPPEAAPAPAGPLDAVDAARAEHEAALASALRTMAQARAGLLRWGALTLGGVVVGTLAGRGDVAPFLALAALFALAASWDLRDRSRTGLPAADALLVPDETGRFLRALVCALPALLAAAVFGGIAGWAAGLPASPAHTLAAIWSSGAACLCLMLAVPAAADLAARGLVPRASASHVARMTAALGAILLLLPVPMRALADRWQDWLGESSQPLVEVGGLLAQLAGEVAIALAAVGLWVARGARATRERLGLGGMGGREWAIAALGLGVVTALNGGLEQVERTWFPELWKADQAMSERIVGDITLSTSLVLGLSAGVGEEVLVRGALQPRTGLLLASLLFGMAHVQYTWFGMLVIVLLGVTLGLVRRHANTTTAIVVHAAYDVVAALAARG